MKKKTVAKTNNWSRCPGFGVNEKIANCHNLNASERHCLSLIKRLMDQAEDSGHSYSFFIGTKQLAYWLNLELGGLLSMLKKLNKEGFIRQYENGEPEVLQRWRNTPKQRIEWLKNP